MPTITTIRADLLLRLHHVRRSALWVDLTTGLLLHGAIVVVCLLGAILLEMLHPWARTVRVALAVGILGLFVALGVRWILRPALRLAGVLRAESDEAIARRVGLFFPSIRDRLLNALQLTELGERQTLYSGELLAESLRDVAGATAVLDLTSSVDARPVPRAARWFVISLMSALLVLLAFPHSSGGAVYRIIHFWRDYTPPSRFLFEVRPGNRNLVRGESVEIRIRLVPNGSLMDRVPRSIALAQRIEGQSTFDETELTSDSSRAFRVMIPAVRATTEYFAHVDEVASPTFMLTVQDRPVVRTFRVRVDPPAYTGQPSRLQDDFAGDIVALAGSRATLSGSASKLLHSAVVEFADNLRVPLAVHEDRFTGTLPVERDGSYILVLTDGEGLANPTPVRYQVKVSPDRSPTVDIVVPGRNIDADGDAPLDLRIHASDDFGLTAMHLGYRLIRSRFEQAAPDYTLVTIPLPAGSGTDVDLPFVWDLSSLHLVPEDVVAYVVDVFDNDQVHGPKRGQSPVYEVRLPSLEEVLAESNQTQDRSVDELSRTMEEAKRLKENLEAIDRDLKQNKPADWQTQKKMEELAKRYEKLTKQVAEARKDVEQAAKQLEEQHVLSGETLEKYLELQQALSQIDSAELQQLLKQMQQGMPNVSPEQLRQAMQQATFSEERFRQSIERTLELLKRLQVEQKVGAVKARAEDLARKQDALREETSKASSGAERQKLATQQQELAGREREMEQESRDLQKRMEEFFNEMPADQMAKLNEQLAEQQVAEGMEQAGREMEQGQTGDAQRKQQSAGKQLSEFRKSLEQMQQQMMQQQNNAVVSAMRKATRDLLELSRRQEALKEEAQSSPSNSPQLREQAPEQQALSQGLQNVIADLLKLSQRSFAVTPEMGREIGQALAHMNAATQRLDARNGGGASQEETESMGALNRAAQQVQQTMSQLMQQGGGGAGSLLQQLQSLAGKQMGLNMQTREMNEGSAGQQAGDAARLAQQQEAVRKSLEQLNAEARSSANQDRIMGDLAKIADEMKEVVRNLEQNDVNPETIRRQERILSRMLDASTSMREQDFEKRRKARTGNAIARRAPADLDPTALEGRGGIREDLLKALEQGYAKDYEILIRKYFEQLEKAGSAIP